MADNSIEQSVAHHGAPILTQRDIGYCVALVEWIKTARKFGGFGYGPDWLPSYPDIVKSRLFWRLRSGKPPLDTPPPRAYSCPWYELIDESDRPHWAYELSIGPDGRAYIAQCPYDVVESSGDGTPALVRFNDYEFRCWVGSHPDANGVQGWWLQLYRRTSK